MKFHISWKGKRSMTYKNVDTFSLWMRFDKTVWVEPKADNIHMRVVWAVIDGIRASTGIGVPTRMLEPKGGGL